MNMARWAPTPVIDRTGKLLDGAEYYVGRPEDGRKLPYKNVLMTIKEDTTARDVCGEEVGI